MNPKPQADHPPKTSEPTKRRDQRRKDTSRKAEIFSFLRIIHERG